MSEEDLPDAEQFRLERERAQREQAEWPRRLEKLCREAEARWRAAASLDRGPCLVRLRAGAAIVYSVTSNSLGCLPCFR
jgi:hypothetical protein